MTNKRLLHSGLGILSMLSGTMAVEAANKPNIIIILMDDLGWKDPQYMGSDFYETPNVDKLSKQGMIFNNAYAAAGNCAPSRACLISGQYTPRHGIFAVTSTDRGPIKDMRLVPYPNNENLALENFTIAEAMKTAGYTTGIFGKWHLGIDEAHEPKHQGFDVDKWSHPQSKEDFKENNDPKMIYKITSDACKFIEDNKNKPFFAYIAHHAVHTGYEARSEMIDYFKNKPKGKYHSNSIYAAMWKHADDGIGVLLHKLDSLNIRKNTLIIFMSDNGAVQSSPQFPLRGYKGGYYEGGIRVPFFAVWPGVIKPGTKCEVPIINLDLYPTCMDAAGTAPPKDKILDGESLVKLFKGGDALQRQAIFWHFPGYLNGAFERGHDTIFRTTPVTTMRKGDWKLMLYHEEWILDGGRKNIDSNHAVQLYNLKDDIGETKDLANINKQKRDELLDDMLAWMDKIHAQMPTKIDPNVPRKKDKRSLNDGE